MRKPKREYCYIDVGHLVGCLQPLLSSERAAYGFLLAFLASNGSLPDDNDRIAALMKIPVPEWMAIRPMIEKYFRVENGVWQNDNAHVRSREPRMEASR